jgi:DNA mismatch repair ATPase MutS
MELGDFYNTFDDDAERVGTICKITVQYTSRATSGLTITGFPKNAALRNVAKLIEHGFQVALVQSKNDSRVDVKLNPYGG